MSTKTLQKEVDSLKREVASLRSLVIKVVSVKITDPEGDYKPKFVKAVLSAVREKATYEYAGKGSLLKQVRQMK